MGNVGALVILKWSYGPVRRRRAPLTVQTHSCFAT